MIAQPTNLGYVFAHCMLADMLTKLGNRPTTRRVWRCCNYEAHPGKTIVLAAARE